MPKLRAYPAFQLGGVRPPIREYTLKAGETFKRGDLVALDSNEDVLEVSGADPSSILGVAAEDAEGVVRAGFVIVWLATGDSVFAMQGDADPTEDDVNQDYGIIEDGDGVYTVDTSETTNTRVYVVDVDTENNLFFVIFLDANRVVKA